MKLLRAAAFATAAALAASVASAAAPAGPKPKPPAKLAGSVRIVFSGQGTETLKQYRQWIYELDNRCGYDKTVENVATFSWTATWDRVPLQSLARGVSGRAPTAAAPTGRVVGAEVRTDCGYPEPLEGWAGTTPCDEALAFRSPATLDVAAGRAGTAVVDLQAPPLGLARPTACGLNPRNGQLTASFPVALKALARLTRGKTLTIRVGPGAPRSLVAYAPDYNCAASEPPYEGIRIEDTCKDTLVWEGTVTFTKL